jgi:hypothetical protein
VTWDLAACRGGASDGTFDAGREGELMGGIAQSSVDLVTNLDQAFDLAIPPSGDIDSGGERF